MPVQFLYPAMFIALAGLLLPLAIHLWNRRRGRIILFGSTQFLEATQRKKISQLSFTQPFLFLLRALMITCCVLLLAEPIRVTMAQVLPQKKSNWLLISPSLLDRNDWQKSIDTIRYRDYERRVLARDFSLLNEKNDNTAFAENTTENIWSLLADAAVHKQAPDSIAVFFTPKLSQFKGTAPALHTHIAWHEIPPFNDSHHILRAWQHSDNKLTLIIGKSNEEHTFFERFTFVKKGIIQADELPDIIFDKNEERVYFKNKKQAAVSIENKPELRAVIYYDSSFKKDRNYLNAALTSISEYTDIQIDVKKERIKNGTSDFHLNEEADAVFYLSKTPLNDSLINSSNVQLFIYKKHYPYKEDVIEKTFAEGKKNYVITRRLTNAESTTKLPQKLLEILLTPNDFDQQLAQFDQRKITSAQYQITPLQRKTTDTATISEEKRIAGFHHVLWWILAGLFFMERLVNSTDDFTG